MARTQPRIAIVGLGLIGGSIALAAHERLGAYVTGHDVSAEALDAAIERGAVDQATNELAAALDGATAAFVAVPVGVLPGVVDGTLRCAGESCVVTDVGSTKRTVVASNDDPRFVGGHPLAGAESSGIEYARPDLFEAATWYLTPRDITSGVLYERLHRLLRSLGARPVAIEADVHDAILANISHLPHVFANVLVEQAGQVLAEGDERLPATGPSFRDATRIAGSSSAIWTDIYLANADALSQALRRTISALHAVDDALRRGDRRWITDWNERAGEARRRLLEAQLAGGPLFELRAAVPNRPGVIAQIALELGRAAVNIVDMALYPAPDMSDGVVALWIAGETQADRAQSLMAGLGFPVARG